MRDGAIRADFYLYILVDSPAEDPAAFFSQKIKGAIAKQTIKFPLRFGMTGEEHTCFIRKEFMIIFHGAPRVFY